MFFQRLWQWLNRPTTTSRTRPTTQCRARLMVEPLEDRAVPASFTAATVPELIAGITAANQSPEADTITLSPGKTFTLTQPWTEDAGLPVIAPGAGNLTIIGNGDVIERSTWKNTWFFRLFYVQAGASLTLQDLTVQGGSAAYGGAIFNGGALTMIDVTVQKNVATSGGGIYSDGSLTLQDCLIQNNQALGRDGYDGFKFRPVFDKHGSWLYVSPSAGGWGLGGGLYIAGGTAELLGTTVRHNSARGGLGGKGGGSGLPNAPDGFGQGGGIYIESDAAVILDAFTAAHVTENTADFDPDIYGTFSIT
jgi:predicted outer membrane repeat protein